MIMSSGNVGIPLARGRFTILAKLGSGSFGEVYVATDESTQQLVSVKMQKAAKKSPLCKEYIVYKEIQRAFPSSLGYPTIYYYGFEGDYEVLVMELLGPSIEELFNHCNRCLSATVVYSLGAQILNHLQKVHELGFVHRDLKPANLVMGNGTRSHYVHLIDFGLCSRYLRDKKDHIELCEDKPFVGTTRFCSLNVHRGLESSRRDDLESLGYVLAYLYHGTLPWQTFKSSSKEQMRNLVMESKETAMGVYLGSLPPVIAEFINSSRRLAFKAVPDYVGWIERFKTEMDVPFEDMCYDWEEGFVKPPLPGSRSWSPTSLPNQVDSS